MYVDLVVLLEPGVHAAELELDQPVELWLIKVDGSTGVCTTVSDNDVEDLVLEGRNGLVEVLLGHILCFEEVVWKVGLLPAMGRDELYDRADFDFPA